MTFFLFLKYAGKRFNRVVLSRSNTLKTMDWIYWHVTATNNSYLLLYFSLAPSMVEKAI